MFSSRESEAKFSPVIEFNKSISEALEILEKQTYIRRNNEEYEFLTDEEKDIEEEIKNTDLLTESIFDVFKRAAKKVVGWFKSFFKKIR